MFRKMLKRLRFQNKTLRTVNTTREVFRNGKLCRRFLVTVDTADLRKISQFTSPLRTEMAFQDF